MVSIDLDRLETAITSISRLAEGRNPVTGEQTEYLPLEDPKVIRCLYSAEKIMTEVFRGLDEGSAEIWVQKRGVDQDIDLRRCRKEEATAELAQAAAVPNGEKESIGMESQSVGMENQSAGMENQSAGMENQSAGMGNQSVSKENQSAEEESDSVAKKKKVPFPYEILSLFIYREDKSITHLLRQFAEPAGEINVRLPGAAAIHRWFGENGYLVKEALEPGGQEFWMPTQKGSELGLYTREGMFRGRQIVSVMFNEPAQYFLAANLEKIVQEIQK